MATAASPMGINDTKCPICCEMFTEPKLLPCSHVICKACLVLSLQESNQQDLQGTSQQALCPQCGYIIIEDPKEQHGEEWGLAVVDTLPTQVALKALVESTRLLSKSHTCRGCTNKNASYICLTCGELLCKPCTKIHRNMPMTSHHKAESLASMTPENLAESQPSFCSIHIKEPAHFFCQVHDTIICRLCATSPGQHSSCEMTISKQCKTKGESQNTAATAAAMNEIGLGGMDPADAIRLLDRQMAEVEKQSRRTLSAVDSNCENMENSLQAFRRRMRQQALDDSARAKARILEARDMMVARKESLDVLKEMVDRIRRELPSNPHLLNELPALQAKVKEMTDQVANLPQELESVRAASKLRPSVAEQSTVERLESIINSLDIRHTNQRTMSSSSATTQAGKSWHFHPNHGREIVLLNARITAAQKGTGDHDGNIVVSSQPMEVNIVYEVHLDQVDDSQPSYLPCGVMIKSPAELTLPDTAWRGWHNAVVFCQAVYDKGIEKQDAALGDQLFQLPANSHVGVMLDSAGCLHLFINGDVVTTVPDMPFPCFAFFELLKRYKQVTTSPKRQVQ